MSCVAASGPARCPADPVARAGGQLGCAVPSADYFYPEYRILNLEPGYSSRALCLCCFPLLENSRIKFICSAAYLGNKILSGETIDCMVKNICYKFDDVFENVAETRYGAENSIHHTNFSRSKIF